MVPVGQHGHLQVMRVSVGQGGWISLRGRAEGRSEGGGPHLGHGKTGGWLQVSRGPRPKRTGVGVHLELAQGSPRLK